MKRDKEKTTVIFRKWKVQTDPGDIIALFPWVEESPGRCSSFEHVGQHGRADYCGVIRLTTPATPAEYADLKRELEQYYGYNLTIRKRRSR